MASQTVALLMLPSFKAFNNPSTTLCSGYRMIVPIVMQAEVRTFQKLSLSSSTNLFMHFLFGYWHTFESTQQAALRILLSLSHKHLLTRSIDS